MPHRSEAFGSVSWYWGGEEMRGLGGGGEEEDAGKKRKGMFVDQEVEWVFFLFRIPFCIFLSVNKYHVLFFQNGNKLTVSHIVIPF